MRILEIFYLHSNNSYEMAANTDERDETRDEIAQQLSPTPFACSSLTRLSGGTANFVYRGTLSSTGQSIVIKHTKDHSASNPDFKIDVTRCVSCRPLNDPALNYTDLKLALRGSYPSRSRWTGNVYKWQNNRQTTALIGLQSGNKYPGVRRSSKFNRPEELPALKGFS